MLGVGWLMPNSVAPQAPLPLLADPAAARRPSGCASRCQRALRPPRPGRRGGAGLVGGREVQVGAGRAAFTPVDADTSGALRPTPDGPLRDAGALVDWRTALGLLPPRGGGAREGGRGASGDLGDVRGTAQVWADGADAGVRLWHPLGSDLEGRWGLGPQRLRVRVSNTVGAHCEVARRPAW